MRRLIAFLLTLTLVATLTPAARAQSDTGEIWITVQDAGSKAPVILARVLLDGPVVTTEYTGNDGKVHFIDVPDGIYRARVFARGFEAVTSANFEVTNGRSVTVAVELAQSTASPLRTIASVVSKSTATVSATAVTANSAQRKLSDTLADALGTLSGVNLTTSSNDSDATQTISLEGQDASQTALSVNGIPLNGPGSAGNVRAINSDLFTGANVSFGPQTGGFGGGGVGFSTLQPTLSWQSEFSLSAGSNGKNNYLAAESGSIGKLGFAFTHTFRATPSLLDGMTFLDASGLTYSHNGDRNSSGTLLNMRYQLTDAQTLSALFMHSVNSANIVCTQFTGPVPCGYGPDNTTNTNFDLYSLTDNALIGDTQVAASFYGTRVNTLNDMLNRFVGGVAQPTGTQSTNYSNGFTLNATLPARDRHTISITANTSNSRSAFTPLVAAAAPYTFNGQTNSYSSVTINDSIRANPKLRFNDSIGISRSSTGPGTLLLGFSTNWAPTTSDTYAFNYNIGGNGARLGREGVLSDPAQLRFDCNGGIAFGSAPGDNATASSSISTRLSYTHKMNGGLISAQVYRQTQNGVVLPVDVNGTALVGNGIFPPNYFAIAQNTYVNECGVPVVSGFGPQNTYFSTPISGVQRVYEGFSLNGYFTLGNLVVEPFYDTQVAKANSSDPRFVNPYAITISGAQLPNVPLHRAGLTLDYKPPRSAFEWLARANYTGSNNSQNLPAYTTIDAGINYHASRGDLTFAASNITNVYGGIFATSQGAVPYVTQLGTIIPTVARPNPPRQYSVTYTVRFGQNVPQSSGTSTLNSAIGGREGGGPGGRGGPGGIFFRQLTQLPQSPPSNPFALNSSTQLCNADSQKIVQPILTALKGYTSQIEAAKSPAGYPATAPPPPVIPGVSVQYHPLGTTYALSISTSKTALLRPVFTCSTFHIADQQTADQRKLFVEPNGGIFAGPTLTFMPAVGLYIARTPPAPGTETFRTYKLPTAPPKNALVYNPKSPTCTTAQMRTTAQTAVAELQAHFAKGAAAPDWTITPNAAKAGTWYALVPEDITWVPALLNCGHVASATRDDLTKLGWDGANPPSLSYSPTLGLYLVTGGFQRQGGPNPNPSGSPGPNGQRRAGGGEGGGFGGGFIIPLFGGGQRRPGASPSPSPAASPSPAPAPAATPH
ncbi:MAG TPA: TonB-dependent receptor [Candidatus Rubrimentiphilum sp.]|nr:TonB-dependent receptor [Candidatus Rubrimentiphilum sp.]